MSSYKTEQRRIVHGGKEWHFVSYDCVLANPARGVEAAPATWYLMNGGKRWEVMSQVPGQPPEELDRCLLAWLAQHVRGG